MNSLSTASRAGYLSVRTAEGASEKQSSLKARLRNGLTYLLTYSPTLGSGLFCMISKLNEKAQSVRDVLLVQN